ncbi:hypothetical protein AVEN_238010-1 [Araneus ventricosus]|uniref:Uncharacterized protein n=1 Tax=Araneus ventricosus TaxID=182803 RepID=A0A4Y2PNG9_ARAVE|nr:hypothetical protein AVEN_238010-1 [Araneus ventricosus]
MLQKEDIVVDVACNLLKGLTAQRRDCRGTIVNELLEESKQPCLVLNVDPSFKEVNEIFGFLSPKQLTTLDNKALKEKATTLANLYQDDLDKEELYVEIESFKYSVKAATI